MTGIHPQQMGSASNPLQNAISFCNVAANSVKRHNPILGLINKIQYTLYIALTFHQKLRMLKNRVNQMHYRLHQMEQTINTNNPYNLNKGSSMNHIR